MIWNKNLRRSKKQRSGDMKVIALYMCGALVLSGIAGHLFSRSIIKDVSTTPEPEDERQVALTKLIKTSEQAINWIGNKTTSSLNGLFKLKNKTSEAIAGEDIITQTSKKKKNVSWLRRAIIDKVHIDSGPSSQAHYPESAEDSDDGFVIAHRDKDNSFSWGPQARSTVKDPTINSSEGFVRAARLRMQKILLYLYQRTKLLADQGKHLFKEGLTKVIAKKDLLMRKYASESREEQLQELEIHHGTSGNADLRFGCNDTAKPVCGVDLDKHYSIFLNECKMLLYNYEHGTNFSKLDSDVCVGLFAQRPDLFYQIL